VKALTKGFPLCGLWFSPAFPAFLFFFFCCVRYSYCTPPPADTHIVAIIPFFAAFPNSAQSGSPFLLPTDSRIDPPPFPRAPSSSLSHHPLVKLPLKVAYLVNFLVPTPPSPQNDALDLLPPYGSLLEFASRQTFLFKCAHPPFPRQPQGNRPAPCPSSARTCIEPPSP